METTKPTYESLIFSELERRFHLYLVGGEFEKLFYHFPSQTTDQQTSPVACIKQDNEVSLKQKQQQAQSGYADPNYKLMLDYLLKKQISNKLENEDRLIATCPELVQLQPILKQLNYQTEFDESLLVNIEAIPWLTNQLCQLAQDNKYTKLLNIPKTDDCRSILKSIGYPLFIWLLPRLFSEVLLTKLHHSLLPLVKRVRLFSQLTSGAIAVLVAKEPINPTQKWICYLFAAINTIPLILIINLINTEILALLEIQRQKLQDDTKKRAVIDNYQFSAEVIRDLISLEEILKPHILESIGFEHIDPMPYILGYAEPDSPISKVFFKARAYAFYKLLFKTGRIQPQETAIFLKKHQLDKNWLHELNRMELTTIDSHIKLHQQLIQS